MVTFLGLAGQPNLSRNAAPAAASGAG